MTIEGDKQYRPVSIIETGPQSALTVRYYRDMISNLMNFKSKVCNHKVIQENWSDEAEMESSAPGGSNHNADDEIVKMVYGPRYIPDGYTRLLVQCMHVRKTGSGSTTWRLRVIRRFNYSFAENNNGDFYGLFNALSFWVFDPTQYPELRTAEWTTSSGTMALSALTVACDVRDRRNQVQFILTSENSDTTTESKIYSLDVTPLLGE